MRYSNKDAFNESWLSEMPMGLGKVGDEFFHRLLETIQEFRAAGLEVVDLGNGYKRMSGDTVAFYWYEENNVILIAVELDIKPQSLVVRRTAKNPDIENNDAHATDLYDVVLNDNYKSLRLMRDNQLSDKGYDLWKRLLTQGKHISVYDADNPGSTMRTLNSLEDMDEFFKFNDPIYKRWQYVISENGAKLEETIQYFHTRRFLELSGL